MERELYAICPEDTEIDPILLKKDDISQYRFSIEALVSTIRKANDFTGGQYPFTSRMYFIGERVVEGLNTAFILAFFPDIRLAEPHLLSLLARIPAQYEQMVVVTPSLSLSQEPIYSMLRASSIFPVTLPASFGQRNFKISYLGAFKRRLPAGVSAQAPALTKKQLADYEKYVYLCQDRLYIPGTFPRERMNDIFLNGHKLRLGDALFALLMRFVAELKKGQGGWVSTSDLVAEGYINHIEHRQRFSNLRTKLEGSLHEKAGTKFIQASGSKEYRLSTHPDFVTYDKEKLKTHPDPKISLHFA